MNIRSFNYPNMISLFGNLESERLGFYFSFCLHLIFLIFVIGYPNFFVSAPINIPTVIPIEIINVTDTTSIPKENVETKKQAKIEEKPKQNLFNNLQEETTKKVKIEEKPKQKKFNNLQSELTQEIKMKTKPIINSEGVSLKEEKKDKEDIKNKTQVKIDENKRDIQEEKFESLPSMKIKPKIKPKPENMVNLNKNKQDIQEEKFESLPSKKIKPKMKLKPKDNENAALNTDIKIKPKPAPNFDMQLASTLKDIRNEQNIINKEKTEKDSTKDKTINNNESNETKAQLSISEIDALIQQLSSCWSSPAGAVIKKGMVVKISAKIRPDRKVFYESVRIVDTNIPQSNPFYGPITESAMRTLLNPECIPLRLPADKYELWKNLTINFDHSIMKGYQ